jgi:hypothetical protein
MLIVVDMQMLTMHNGQERTLGHMRELLDRNGWVLERVHRSQTTWAQFVACPK